MLQLVEVFVFRHAGGDVPQPSVGGREAVEKREQHDRDVPIELAEPRLGGRSIADVLRSSGAEIRDSWCGPCFGQGPDALSPGERAITTFNRNWQNRMGVGGEGFLASPAVVASSALLGYMAPPDALGLEWDPQLFGV